MVKLLLVSGFACWMITAVPSMMFVAAIIWGVSLVLSAYYLDVTRLFLLFATNILLLYFLSSNGMGFAPALMYGMPFLVMGVLVNKGRDYYELQKWGVLTALISVVLLMLITYLSVGQEILLSIDQQVETYVEESIEISKESGIIGFYEERGISLEEVEESVRAMSHTFVRYLPAFYILQAIAAIYLVLLLSAYIARKRQLPILAKKPFKDEIMPWQLAWVVIAGLGLWLWGRNEMSTIYYLGGNILAVVFPITVYFGTAEISYRISRFKPGHRKWAIMFVVFLTLVFSISALVFVGLLGLFDSLLDYRKQRKKEV
ncbi:MAG: DUF2232 domain-containing protein [Bacillota bacterium]|nr:DUF2232 domain-containing protein [Bacillota bacterium]